MYIFVWDLFNVPMKTLKYAMFLVKLFVFSALPKL